MERIWVVWLVWAAMVVGALQGSSGCLEKERMGLMELRKAMPPYELPALPRDNDCCLWDGVICSATTGRVERLSFIFVYRLYPSPVSSRPLNVSLLLPFEELVQLNLDICRFDGVINQADLMELTRLEKLSLTYNNLSNSVSLQAFANMKNLKYLDLSYNDMNIDLKGICEMKNIIELHLLYNNRRGSIPSCIGNLTQLQVFDIGFNQISENIPSTIGNLSHLSYLSLGENYFSGSFSLHFLANNSKLKILTLSSYNNHFQVETETQSWFPSFQLLTLDLSNTNLNKMSDSVIPTFLLHQSELMSIDLSNNKLQTTFPFWLLQNNSKLQYLSMSNNSLIGNLILPNFIHGLLSLDVFSNKIDGKLPDNLQVILLALRSLRISKNRFEGNLPSSFGALKQLVYVDLSSNSFSGELPKTLFENNTGMLHIDFSNNLLHGEISLNLTTLPSLSFLDLSNNKFNGSIEDLPSTSLSRLQYFDVSNNLISGKLPNLINSSYLNVLMVSNNFLEGEIPNTLCHLSQLFYLDISYNNFSGSIPSCLSTLPIQFLNMRNCSLSGVIPDGFSINSTLLALDLSYNNFSRNVLPNWIYSQHHLRILLMAGLQLEGEISGHLCGLENIKIMDLSHNNFNGSIPSCLFKMSAWVVESADDYLDNMHYSSFSPDNLFISPNRLYEVEFTTKGTSISFQGSILNFMNGLDVSSNKLSGQISPQIGDSQAIRALNLSNNRLSGSIPINISRLRKIESLDFSSNNLSGKIPSDIASLTFLSTFNVSNNNLSGATPTGGQFSNFDERNYGGNEFLCGPLLHRLCTTSSSPSTTPPDEQDNDDETIFERTSFWWSFIAAYVTVFISVVVLAGIDTRCSRIWFRIVDVVCSKLFCVFVKLKLVLGIK